MTHTLLYWFHPLFLKIVIGFSLSSFVASALATAVSSLELGWSFLCRLTNP